MRPYVLAALLLATLAAPPAQSQAPELSITPLVHEWPDLAPAFAKFTITVRNKAAQVDAYTITEIQVHPNPDNAASGFYSPTPTLPLLANGQGTFHVWVTGLESPTIPAGNYSVAIKVQSTIDPSRSHVAHARIQRTHPPAPPMGYIDGSVHDASTGELPVAFEPVRVVAFQNESIPTRPAAQTGLNATGNFRLDLPAGNYWLMVEASGYQTAYFGRGTPLRVYDGIGPTAHIALSPELTGRFTVEAPDIGTVNPPPYRLAGSLDLTNVATTPGGYDRRPNMPAEALVLFGTGAQAHWTRSIGEPRTIPIEHTSWRSDDNGVDITKDGLRVATGSAAGQIMVYEVSGQSTWKQPYTGEGDVNPLVPGPLGQGILRSSEVRFSNDGQRLAAGTLTGWVYVFDVANGTLMWKTPTAGQVRALRFDDLDERLYVGSGDNRLHALSAETGAVQWSRSLTHYPAEHIAIGDGGRLIATGGRDGVLRVFDDTGRELWNRQLAAPILGYDMAPGGNPIVAMTRYGVHSFDRNGLLHWYRGEGNNNGQLRLGSASQYIAFGKDAGANQPTIQVLDQDGTLVWEYRHPQAEAIHNVRVLDDGRAIVANGKSGNVYFFEQWTRPPTGTRAPATTGPSGETETRGGSPGLAPLAVLAVLVAVALRRRA